MSELIARTGRVQDWIDNPNGRLPVSCTCINVEDSISDGRDSIQNSWLFASHALRYGAGVAVHLHELRPAGTDNGKGLVASGPLSFAKIYSQLNETLRRGGLYKNGAITLHTTLSHPDIVEYLSATRQELPWAKRCVDIDKESWDNTPRTTRDLLLKKIHSGDIWLNKIRYDKEGNRLYGNVCLEVYLPSRGTCLLEHINLGACHWYDIPRAFEEGMKELCELHKKTGVGDSGEYLSPEEDKQVGLGILGLANLLRHHGVTYEEFGRSLKRVNDCTSVSQHQSELLAKALFDGIWKAKHIADSYGMKRAFCIAPTASCSYRYKDLGGYTVAPEIAPPIATSVDRDSGTFGVESFDYGPVEIASKVGWKTYRVVADEIMKMYEITGLLHGYSMNTWSDVVTYDDAFIEEWLASPQTSMYYALQVTPDTLRKDDASVILDEDYKDIFNLETGNTEEQQYCSVCAE
tara:strand:- start:907 stop:2295 length:1389 start_codon:yes stop_codon:yes gene_type:complete